MNEDYKDNHTNKSQSELANTGMLLTSSERSDTKQINSKDPVKIVVVGPQGSGKTSFIQNIYRQEFQLEMKSTTCYEVNRKLMTFDGRDIEFRIWDCSTYHDQSYIPVKKSFYRNSLCAFIVIDINEFEAIEHHVGVWDQECQANDVQNTIVVCNKLDLFLEGEPKSLKQSVLALADNKILFNKENVNYKIKNNSQLITTLIKLEKKGFKVYYGSCKETYEGIKTYESILFDVLRDSQQPQILRVGSNRPHQRNEEDKNSTIVEQVNDQQNKINHCILI